MVNTSVCKNASICKNISSHLIEHSGNIQSDLLSTGPRKLDEKLIERGQKKQDQGEALNVPTAF